MAHAFMKFMFCPKCGMAIQVRLQFDATMEDLQRLKLEKAQVLCIECAEVLIYGKPVKPKSSYEASVAKINPLIETTRLQVARELFTGFSITNTGSSTESLARIACDDATIFVDEYFGASSK